jgi:hypothetical protein
MKSARILILAVCGLAWVSCASRTGIFRHADEVADISKTASLELKTENDAEKILKEYTIPFRIANPLIEPGSITSNIRRVDPSHEEQIYCKAILLDSLSTEAEIRYQAGKDSLDQKASSEYRKKYLNENVQSGQFRIRIEMESGFSPLSIDPKFWSLSLLDARGVMIEPLQIISNRVVSEQDSIYASNNRIKLARNRIRGEITLVFNRITFFKEDLLGPNNGAIALEITREQKTLARVVWKLSGK